jgi:hypothetical protein
MVVLNLIQYGIMVDLLPEIIVARYNNLLMHS